MTSSWPGAQFLNEWNCPELAQAIRALPRRDVEELREWIEGYLEDQLEFTDEFAESVERGKIEIAEGNVRIGNSEQA